MRYAGFALLAVTVGVTTGLAQSPGVPATGAVPPPLPAAGIFKGEKDYTGSILCMKPNLARLRLDYATDPRDFEAFICNGKSVYAYNGLQKTITEHKLPDP